MATYGKAAVSGRIVFLKPQTDWKIPAERYSSKSIPLVPGSTLTVKLQDTSRACGAAIDLGRQVIRLDGPPQSDIEFRVEAQQPVAAGDMRYSISAVLNVGWDPEGTNEWIRKGDWHNDTRHTVDFSKGTAVDGVQVLSRDLEVTCYDPPPMPPMPTFHQRPAPPLDASGNPPAMCSGCPPPPRPAFCGGCPMPPPEPHPY